MIFFKIFIFIIILFYFISKLNLENFEKLLFFKKNIEKIPINQIMILSILIFYPIFFFPDIIIYLYIIIFFFSTKMQNLFKFSILNIYYYLFFFKKFRFFFCILQNFTIFLVYYYKIILILKLFIIFFMLINIKISFLFIILLLLFNIINFIIIYNLDFFVLKMGQNPFEKIFLTKTGKRKINFYKKNLINYNIFRSEITEFESLDFLVDFFYKKVKYNNY